MANSTHAHMQGIGPGLSQSAPASTGGAMWAGGSSNAPMQAPPPPPPTHGHPHGNAQQVTGMLGATVLDDVDEGDETFGDESELMND
jgi:F-box and leucine-rich repeat protein GRR1